MSQPKRQGSHFNNKTWTSWCLSFECPCGVDDYNKDHNVFQNQEHGNDYEDRIVGENLKNVKLLLEGVARGDTKQLFDSEMHMKIFSGMDWKSNTQLGGTMTTPSVCSEIIQNPP